MVCKTWAVGFRSKAGIAELLPSIVSASKFIWFVVYKFLACLPVGRLVVKDVGKCLKAA
jgi:hypothetical protein